MLHIKQFHDGIVIEGVSINKEQTLASHYLEPNTSLACMKLINRMLGANDLIHK